MTIDCERFWSLQRTKQFLNDLMLWKGPMRKREIRERAYSCLRHFPEDYWLKELEGILEKHKEKKS